MVIATYANGASGLPAPAPGRITFVTGYRQVNAADLTNGSTYTYGLTGGGSGIPAGALGVIYKAYFTSPSAGASLTICPHAAGDNNAYQSIGNIQVANQYANGGGLVQV